ncbi:hypothetical protein VK792_00705 [Mesobacterium sp. TK19101]|uniref:Uncharacterized protein n=1 Tax=Mesobacterium hydrothermale TaxID=3111907 RepID=A0ABU6HBG0_9RHOB|nr:hypothetical protein [Mesobacterium sp. TK19101]MEC3859788.1 hypothetical protein [Mesobacterium sp. TK19101]
MTAWVIAHLFQASLFGAGLFALYSAIGHRRAHSYGNRGENRIRPSRVVIVAVAALSLTVGWLSLSAFVHFRAGYSTGQQQTALALALGFVLIGLAILGNLCPVYAVTWTDHTISGPTGFGIPPFGPARGNIALDDITDIGTDLSGHWYVQATNGTRIRWNGIYTGYQRLLDDLEASQPHLFKAQ